MSMTFSPAENTAKKRSKNSVRERLNLQMPYFPKGQSFFSPQKNSAMVPGPVWEPITVPMLQI